MALSVLADAAMPSYIPLVIFFGRIADVSIGTIRMLVVVGGHRFIAAGLGVCEVLVWIFAVGSAIKYMHEPAALVAYAGGFGSGVLIGMTLEDRIAMGHRIVRIFNPDQERDASALLRERGYRVTRVDGKGLRGPVEIAFLVLERRRLPELRRDIDQVAPGAFVSVERAERPMTGALAPEDRVGKIRAAVLGHVRK